MYGGSSYGELSYSEQDHVPLDMSAFEAWLALVVAKRCWLLEVDAFSLASSGAASAAYSDAAYGELGYGVDSAGVSGGVQTLYFSSHGFISRSTDTPANTWYDGRLTGELSVNRSIAGRGGIGGLARASAEAELVNADGLLDTLERDYALDGRAARIYIGDPDGPRADFGLVFSGVIESATVGLRSMRLRLSDGIAKLDQPMNATTYAGTGGLEGGSDLKGKPKPKCYGHVFNVAPPLVDSASLVYQVNDGAISDVPQVYDRGVLLTKVGGAPAAGEYQVDVAAGTFKLGATPAGTVTANVLGDATLSGYIDGTSAIALRILVQQSGLSSSEIDPASFVNLVTNAPGEVGIWIGAEPRSVASVVDELLAGAGAFGGFSRASAFSVGLVAAPGGEPEATFTHEDILDIAREPLPADVEPVVWRALVGWQKNYTVQGDLAASVSAARRTFAAEALRVAKHEDTALHSRRLLAREFGPVEALYALEADAQVEADRLFDLWARPRAQYRVRARPSALIRDLGDVVELKHPRHGLAAGVPARVIGHAVRGTDVELRVIA